MFKVKNGFVVAMSLMPALALAQATENQYPYIPEKVKYGDAHRLLLQTTFGPTNKLIKQVKKQGIVDWVDSQLNAPSAYDRHDDEHLTYIERTINIAKMANPDYWSHSLQEYLAYNDIKFHGYNTPSSVRAHYRSTWFDNALHGKDQLRQRVAFALSQILVISTLEQLFQKRGEAFAVHNDILAKHAFGNYRDLLIAVSKSGPMGIYLTHQGSKKYNPEKYEQPDENYAREIMQLFTIGLVELELDGTPKLDAEGNTIPAYTQEDVEQLARVFTGWDLAFNHEVKFINKLGLEKTKERGYGRHGKSAGDYLHPMEFTATFHDSDEKTLLGETIPAGLSGQEDLEAAIDILMAHPNMAPFISRQLIMRLVTSNPTPAYIERVSRVFNDNGQGVKGDLKAVVRAIILDQDARSLQPEIDDHQVKFKEPILAYTQFLRAFKVGYTKPYSGRRIATMKKVYNFNKRNLNSTFGQEAMNAKSVFNFYSPDYIPGDDYFKDNALVAPELEIQSWQVLAKISNRLAEDISTYEKIRLRSPGRAPQFQNKFLLSLHPELKQVSKAVQGDFNNLRDVDLKEQAVDRLLKYLNKKLTNSNLTAEQLRVIKDHLMQKQYVSSNRDSEVTEQTARIMIVDAVKLITTTSTYMVQR